MDKIIDQIGNEAGPHVTLRRLAEDRKKLEVLSPPEKKNRFHEWKLQREEEFKAQMKTIAYGMVGQASRDIASVYSEEGLVDHTLKNIEKEQLKVAWPSVMLSYLPLLVAALEDACYGKEKEAYDTRFREIDREIQRITVLIPKSFDPSMINVDKRFPVERCGQDKDGRWFDRWLTEGLKEKKPIYYDDHEKYIDALCRYYHEIYWTTAEKEREEKEKAVAPPPVEENPVFSNTINPQAAAIEEFHRMGDPVRGEPSLGWAKQRLYRGGTKS